MGHMVKYPDRRDGSTLFDFYGNIIPASGGGLVFTAKGDIPVGTGPGAGVMQAVGTNGQVLTADSTQTDGVKWATPTGAVGSVTAGDASLVISPTTGAVVAEAGTLDQIANLHPPAANWSNNSHKITGLANGTASTDAAAFGQIPAVVVIASTVFSANAYNLALTDGETAQQASNGGTAASITVPTNASVAFPIGTIITITQTGTGKVTITAAGGVTITSSVTGGFSSGVTGCRAEFSTIGLLKTATDTWVITGDAA